VAPKWRVLSFNDKCRAFERSFGTRLQGPEGFIFASSFNTTQVQRKPSRTSGLHSRAASTRRKLSASLQGPAGFFFTSSLDRTQVLHTVPQQEVGGADGLKKRRMCFCRTLHETCVADSLHPANMRYLQVEQRVGGARYMYAVYTLYFVLQVRGLAPSFICSTDCLSYIHVQSASIHTMVPVHI